MDRGKNLSEILNISDEMPDVFIISRQCRRAFDD
jgi:hypothetical protein